MLYNVQPSVDQAQYCNVECRGSLINVSAFSFSMFPLFLKDGLVLPFCATTCLFCLVTMTTAMGHPIDVKAGFNRRVEQVFIPKQDVVHPALQTLVSKSTRVSHTVVVIKTRCSMRETRETSLLHAWVHMHIHIFFYNGRNGIFFTWLATS